MRTQSKFGLFNSIAKLKRPYICSLDLKVDCDAFACVADTTSKVVRVSNADLVVTRYGRSRYCECGT